MNRNTPVVVFLSLMAFLPVILAVNQTVPAGSVFKQVVLLLSLAALGLVLGQFWLSRLGSRNVATVNPTGVLRWHKAVGYSVCGFLLIHPTLMVVRRFWVQESDPVDNMLLMLRAPALLPAIVGWVLLALLVVFSIVRRQIRPRLWRILHGLLSACFVGLTTWHVVAVGRHSNTTMSVFWIALAVAAIGTLLNSYLQVRTTHASSIEQGVTHEYAR